MFIQHKPTVEDYDAQQSYLDREIQFAQDDMVNALGSGKVEVGDEAWYKYYDRVNELAEQRDAYNMGRMGQLDGERAVAASEQASSGGGTRIGSLNGDDRPIHVSEDEEEPKDGAAGFVDSLIDTVGNAGRWVIDTVTGGLKWAEENSEAIGNVFEFAEEERQRILETPLSELSLEDLKKREKLETKIIEQDFDTKIEEEIGKQTEEKRQQYIEEYENMNPMQMDILERQGVNSVKEYVDFMFDQKNWDDRKKVNRQFEKLLEGELSSLEDTFAPYYVGLDAAERIGELEENPELDEQVNSIGTQEKIYSIINDTDMEISDDRINELINTALNSANHDNIYGIYKDFYNDGRLDVSVQSYEEYELTKEEATNLYFIEQEKRVFKREYRGYRRC